MPPVPGIGMTRTSQCDRSHVGLTMTIARMRVNPLPEVPAIHSGATLALLEEKYRQYSERVRLLPRERRPRLPVIRYVVTRVCLLKSSYVHYRLSQTCIASMCAR
jgi:hypothetical protein